MYFIGTQCEQHGCFLTQFVFNGLQDTVRVTEHAGCCGTDLNVIFSHRLTKEHGVERCYFIHSHRRDFKNLCNLVI